MSISEARSYVRNNAELTNDQKLQLIGLLNSGKIIPAAVLNAPTFELIEAITASELGNVNQATQSYNEKLIKLNRSDFYVYARQSLSVDSFLRSYEECNFPDLLRDDIADYYTDVSSRNSSNIFEEVRSSPYENSENGLKLNKVRRSHLIGSPDLLTIKILDISNELLKNIMCEKFFSSDNDRLEEFLGKQAKILDKFRNYFCNFNRDTRQHIVEVDHFQPLFTLYLNGLIEDLQLQLEAKRLNRQELKRTVRLSENGMFVDRSLSGYSDVGIKLTTTQYDILEYLLSLVELKSPFASFWRSGSLAQIDQQYAQLITFDNMKILYRDNDNNITAYSSVGLTDLFKFSVMIKYPEIDFCCATTSVINSKEYVLNVLMLFLNYSDPDVQALVVKCTGAEIPVTDDEGNIIEKNNYIKNNHSNSSIQSRSQPKSISKSSNNKENSNYNLRIINMNDEFEEYILRLDYLNEMELKRQHLGTLTASKLNTLSKK